MLSKLVPLVDAYPHHIYVEPFGGGASVLIAKKPAPVEVYNDVDSGLVNFFRVLADPKKFEQFYRRVAVLPYSRELYYECRDTWQTEEDEVERAVKWFVVARQSFAGCFGADWGYHVFTSRRGMALSTSRWLSAIDRLPEIHARLARVQIEHDDFRKIFPRYDSPRTLFYCDPPYVWSTRKSGEYEHELSDEDHRELVEILLTLQGAVILSGYPNDIYKPLEEAGWLRIDWKTACCAAGRTRFTGLQGPGAAKEKQPRVESAWLCPKVQARLREVGLLPSGVWAYESEEELSAGDGADAAAAGRPHAG